MQDAGTVSGQCESLTNPVTHYVEDVDAGQLLLGLREAASPLLRYLAQFCVQPPWRESCCLCFLAHRQGALPEGGLLLFKLCLRLFIRGRVLARRTGVSGGWSEPQRCCARLLKKRQASLGTAGVSAHPSCAGWTACMHWHSWLPTLYNTNSVPLCDTVVAQPVHWISEGDHYICSGLRPRTRTAQLFRSDNRDPSS